MNVEQLNELLSSLSGHLQAKAPQDDEQIQELLDMLGRSLLSNDVAQFKGSRFAFEQADLFLAEQIAPERAASLRALAEMRLAESAKTPEYRVFAREVPVRSTQLHASAPLWAGGAQVERSIGPLTNRDGRQFWFDFFRIQRLVALHLQGQVEPVLLFHVNTFSRFLPLPPIPDLLTTYQLPAGTIWINSRLLAPDAPADYYSGLLIQGGTVTLSVAPTLVDDKLMIPPNTTVHVNLELQQPEISDAEPSSPYGIDARNAAIQLPRTFAFHFSSQARIFDTLGDASWNVYGNDLLFRWDAQALPQYNTTLHRVLIPLSCSAPDFSIRDCQSPFHTLRGDAPIAQSAWALPAAPIDILNPTAAAGIGAMLVVCDPGLTNLWRGLEGGEIALQHPMILGEPGRIAITDLKTTSVVCRQSFQLWQDEQNPFGSSVELVYPATTPFFYNTLANGTESIMLSANAEVKADRPVTVAGQTPAIISKNSLFMLAASSALRLVYLFDDNILVDNLNPNQTAVTLPPPIAFALHNALFRVTPVNGCLLVGMLDEQFSKAVRGNLLLTFGLQAYLPTLPDPYAADLKNLRFQFQRGRASQTNQPAVFMWLVCMVQWQPGAEDDRVNVSFHFAPLQQPFAITQPALPNAPSDNDSAAVDAGRQPGLCETLLAPRPDPAENDPPDQPPELPVAVAAISTRAARFPDFGEVWDGQTACLQQDLFALLDVSTNADLLGISFNRFGDEPLEMVRSFAVNSTNAVPFQIDGMDVVSRGNQVRAFTVPQISWEPVLNTSPHAIPGDPPGYPVGTPPYITPNYYPDDGGPTRLYTNSVEFVPLAPLPVSRFIVRAFNNEPGNITSSLFTLPFGMRALATLSTFTYPAHPPRIDTFRPSFDTGVRGGLQIQFHAGKLPTDEYPMFNGATVQTSNVRDMFGNVPADGPASTLGSSVSFIFNNEFKLKPNPLTSRGVPLSRIDFSGYGASMFSDWFNPMAQMAQTSQTKFDVWVGRTAHEVVQVKSIVYPWGIRVVRTIILYRAASGYEYRVDTGWQAESDGRFDFSYYLPDPGDLTKRIGVAADYAIHPGVVKGLFNVKNIVEQNNQFPTTSTIKNGQVYLDENNFPQTSGGDMSVPAMLQMVTFDADVEIEGVVQGHVNGRVPAKKVVGFVQLLPRGIPLSTDALVRLLSYQPEPIGGPLDCVVDIGKNGQKLRVNRFDVSNSVDTNGSDPVFVASARGSVVLPKDGAWSMVQHTRNTGEVVPLPQQLAVPLVRTGQITYQKVVSDGNETLTQVAPDPAASLLRIANPKDLVRAPAVDTINYGFLLSTDTQKALFLTPAYKLLGAGDTPMLLSKTPPLFVDAFRIVNSKGIFPNVGNAGTTFGDAISLFSKGTEFAQNALSDGGTKVLELMQINQLVGGVEQEGYKLLKKLTTFDLPSTSWTLVEVGSAFKISIEYRADKVQKPAGAGGGTQNLTGALDFDIDSFAAQQADRWKSVMSNVGLVVDLGPIKRLMTIKGNWNANSGAEAEYGGSQTNPDFPSPQIEFAPELQPVIDILQILQDLQGENYKDAFQKGLKLAMSNKAGGWEYKLEASKEIPVVRFPMPDFLYNDPNAPLKLEAGLRLGAYFNAALKIPTDANQLLPSAGGYLGFYGRLSVMCVSLSIATIYAVGQVNLDIGADTKLGPSLRMKFGFGAQVVVGLPVVGNVSILYMVGVEIYADKTKIQVSAFLLFQGHAELLGGLIGVTITIEAKGTVSRADDRTDLAAQVTFGLDISIFLVIDISFSESWQEQRQIA